MHFKDVGGGRDLAAREWVIRDLATARETEVAKDVAVGTVDTEILRSIKYRKCLIMRQEGDPHAVILPSCMTGGNILPLMIMSRGSLISSGVGGEVAEGSN